MNKNKRSETTSLSDTEWQHPWSSASISSHNSLLLDYFYYEGLYDLHHSFAKETGLSPKNDKLFKERASVRTSLEDGCIDVAIGHINGIGIEILDSNTNMYYALMYHKAAEYINECHKNESFKFENDTYDSMSILKSQTDSSIPVNKDTMNSNNTSSNNSTINEKDLSINSDSTFSFERSFSYEYKNNVIDNDLIEKTLHFIQNELSSSVENNPQLLPALENLMEYFVFNLGDDIQTRRRRVGGFVNEILMNIYSGNNNELKEIVKGVIIGEKRLEKKFKFPTFRSYNV